MVVDVWEWAWHLIVYLTIEYRHTVVVVGCTPIDTILTM